MTDRVVVHSLADDAAPVADVADRLRARGIAVVEQHPHMLLVDGTINQVSRALGRAQGWDVTELTSVPRPRPRMRSLSRR